MTRNKQSSGRGSQSQGSQGILVFQMHAEDSWDCDLVLKCPHWLMCLITWCPAGGTVWGTETETCSLAIPRSGTLRIPTGTLKGYRCSASCMVQRCQGNPSHTSRLLRTPSCCLCHVRLTLLKMWAKTSLSSPRLFVKYFITMMRKTSNQ